MHTIRNFIIPGLLVSLFLLLPENGPPELTAPRLST